MGTTNLEGSMRAALATAELDDADLRQIYVIEGWTTGNRPSELIQHEAAVQTIRRGPAR